MPLRIQCRLSRFARTIKNDCLQSRYFIIGCLTFLIALLFIGASFRLFIRLFRVAAAALAAGRS